MKLVPYRPESPQTPTAFLHSLQEVREFAEIVLQSEMFKDVKSAAQAVVKIARGRELGLGPMESLSSLHVVDGKVTMSAQLMAALAQRSGYRYKVTELTDQICRLMWYDADGEQLGPSEFTMHDAHRAGLTRRQNWRKYPKAMLQARALAAGARLYAAAALLGVYDPDELRPDAPEPEAPARVIHVDQAPPGATQAPQGAFPASQPGRAAGGAQPHQGHPAAPGHRAQAPHPQGPFQGPLPHAAASRAQAAALASAVHPSELWNEASQRIRTIAIKKDIGVEELRLVIRHVFQEESSTALNAKDLHFIADALEQGDDDRHHEWLEFAIKVMDKAHYSDEIIEQAFVDARTKIWHVILLHRHLKAKIPLPALVPLANGVCINEKCKAPIVWGITKSGGKIPLDPGAIQVQLTSGSGEPQKLYVQDHDGAVELHDCWEAEHSYTTAAWAYQLHHASCAGAPNPKG